jgi:hypothetical protein
MQTQPTPNCLSRKFLNGVAKYRVAFSHPRSLNGVGNTPRLASTIARPDAVACLECGLLLAKLDRRLKGAHSLTSRQYKEKWGPEAAVLCRRLLDLYTSQLSKAWQTPRELRKKPKPRSRGKALPSEQSIPEARLTELRLGGKTFPEMARLLGLSPAAGRAKGKLLERSGFPRMGPGGGGFGGKALSGCIFEHGTRFTQAL